ncbi:DUF262 domain-containing protein [Cetobacterium somerae]
MFYFDDIEKKIEEEKEIEMEEEIEIEEGSEKNIMKPFDTKSIKISNAVISLESLVKRLKFDEIDLNPDFQRNSDLWNRTKMSRLIESIILRLPLPIFYFDVSDSDKWIVIDGLQRLSTIKRFIVDKNLRLNNLEFLTELNGKNYDDLGRSIQRIIEETQINTYQMEPQTPKEVRYSIFNRINTGGLSLNPQEIRQALNQKNSGVKYLKEIVEDNTFKSIVGITSKRMIDRELVLRYFAFKLCSYQEFYKEGITLSAFLDKAMEYIDSEKFTQERFDKMKLELLSNLIFLNELFEQKFLFNKKLIDEKKTATLNRSLFEIWTVSISELSRESKEILLNKKEIFYLKYKELLKTQSFEDSITKGTNDRKSVLERFKQLESLLKEIIDV